MTDSQTTIATMKLDRVSTQQRYVAIRLAMMRQFVEHGVIRLVKADTATNLADIFTKPLEHAVFVRLCGRIMGLEDASTLASQGGGGECDCT